MAVFARTALVVYLILQLATGYLCEVVITNVDDLTPLESFRSMAASFGKHVGKNGLKGFAIEAYPLSGCKVMKSPPDYPTDVNWFAVISRYGGCTFEDKVRNAQEAGFQAAIVFNVDSNKVIPMGGNDDNLIPSIFIGYASGQKILSQFTYTIDPDVNVWILDDEPFDINAYLLPFAIVVGICFLIMLGIVLYKCIQDHRRRRRHRLPKSALKKLPIHKFKDGDPYETCCICLDDFEEGDKLRILPCDHGYHYKCIDPWLVKNKRICPQCRKRVFDRGSGYSGDSDSENEGHNERAPLIRPSTSTGGGTFGGASTSRSAMERLQQGSLPSSSGALQGGPGPSNSGAGQQPELPGQIYFDADGLDRRHLRRTHRPGPRSNRGYEALAESSSSDDDDDDGDIYLHNEHPRLEAAGVARNINVNSPPANMRYLGEFGDPNHPIHVRDTPDPNADAPINREYSIFLTGNPDQVPLRHLMYGWDPNDPRTGLQERVDNLEKSADGFRFCSVSDKNPEVRIQVNPPLRNQSLLTQEISNEVRAEIHHVNVDVIEDTIAEVDEDVESPSDEQQDEAIEDPPEVVVTGRSPESHNSTENV